MTLTIKSINGPLGFSLTKHLFFEQGFPQFHYSHITELKPSLYLANGSGRPKPGRARAFGDEARHGTEMKRVVPCRPAGLKGEARARPGSL
jgi:hypothetical protein